MTKEHAYAYESGYQDGLRAAQTDIDRLREERDTYRDLVGLMDHPDLNVQINAENDKLRDENARLLSCLTDDGENARAILHENAKLRELVRQMYPRAKAFLQMGVQLGCNDSMSYDWQLQMRELGVEVDG